MAELGLEPKQAKTRIVHLREGGEGLDFLGFHHRWVRARGPQVRHITFLARWPSPQAMQHARERVRQLTTRQRLLLPVEEVTREINTFLRGWGGLLPLRELRPPLRRDHRLRVQPPRPVRRQAPTARA
jgi:RNA-directed DNA polymerase